MDICMSQRDWWWLGYIYVNQIYLHCISYPKKNFFLGHTFQIVINIKPFIVLTLVLHARRNAIQSWKFIFADPRSIYEEQKGGGEDHDDIMWEEAHEICILSSYTIWMYINFMSIVKIFSATNLMHAFLKYQPHFA